MYWLDNNTGVPTAPTPPAVISTTKRYFTNGGSGVQPSIPEDLWFNMVTDELLAVLAEAGISPDKASHTQLRDAIKKVVANAAATQAEVNESNPANQVDKYVTVKTLWGWVKQATESVLGMMKVATQAQTNAGTADDVAVTPKKLRAGFAVSLVANGYIALPTWMGGLIIQWGNANNAGSATSNVTLPIAFPNASFAVCITGVQGGGNQQAYAVLNSHNLTGFAWNAFYAVGGSAPSLSGTAGQVQARWLALGY